MVDVMHLPSTFCLDFTEVIAKSPLPPFLAQGRISNPLFFVTTQLIRCMTFLQHWIPAFAGMTSRTMPFSSQVIPAKVGTFRYPEQTARTY